MSPDLSHSWGNPANSISPHRWSEPLYCFYSCEMENEGNHHGQQETSITVNRKMKKIILLEWAVGASGRSRMGGRGCSAIYRTTVSQGKGMVGIFQGLWDRQGWWQEDVTILIFFFNRHLQKLNFLGRRILFVRYECEGLESVPNIIYSSKHPREDTWSVDPRREMNRSPMTT